MYKLGLSDFRGNRSTGVAVFMGFFIISRISSPQLLLHEILEILKEKNTKNE